MEIFQNLSINANDSQMETIAAEIGNLELFGWKRDLEAEAKSQPAISLTKPKVYCFRSDQKRPRREAMLVITKSANQFEVSNIIPLDDDDLTPSQYNSLLKDFHNKALEPVIKKLGVNSTLSGNQAGPETWFDEATAQLLYDFVSNANKWTAASHPLDRDRWNAFVLAVHQRQASDRLDPETLGNWLVEEHNWSPEIAEQLAAEYESGLELLEYASSHSGAN